MDKEVEEYAKISLSKYDKLKNDSENLSKADDAIKYVYCDKEGNNMSSFWYASTYMDTIKKLEIDLKSLLSALGYNIDNFDKIVINNLPKNNDRLEL